MHVCRRDASSNDYQLRPQRLCLRGLKHVPSKQHQHLLLTLCVERGADASRHYQLSSVSPKPFANKLENPHKCIPHPRFNSVSHIGICHVPLLLLTTYTYAILLKHNQGISSFCSVVPFWIFVSTCHAWRHPRRRSIGVSTTVPWHHLSYSTLFLWLFRPTTQNCLTTGKGPNIYFYKNKTYKLTHINFTIS